MKGQGVRDAVCPGPRLTLLNPGSCRIYTARQPIVPGPADGTVVTKYHQQRAIHALTAIASLDRS